MIVEKYVTTKKEIEIVGATLLSMEEAELIPRAERKYENWWWLRSPGYYTYYATYVYPDGDILDYGRSVHSSLDCVRPALILKNIEKTDFQIGDVFAVRGEKFKIISSTLAWMYEGDIGCCAFRKNWKARSVKTASNYEKSDVKKYVDNWFKELTK